MTTSRLSLLFRIDAVANLVLAAAAFAILAAPDLLGVPRWALATAGALMLGNAYDLARTGRRTPPDPRAVRRSALADVVFAAALLAVAVAGLQGQSDSARWALAIVGDVSLVVGAIKLVGLRATRLATA